MDYYLVVKVLKYIGPFLRINTLSKDNIEKQLLYFTRESLKHIVLNSRCGITANLSDFKTKNIPNFDISTFKKNSPLLCVFRKANPKLSEEHSNWDEDTFKKEINIGSNAFMTMSLLDYSSYYEKFKDIDNSLYSIGKLYSMLARKQLDFYSAYLRNSEGVFVDKKDESDGITGEFKFEEKDSKFKYSDQAYLMCAFYKAGCMPDNKDAEAYKSFSLDILDMFHNYKDEIYSLSYEETNKLCLAFNIFCYYSENDEAKLLLMDLCDLLIDKYEDKSEIPVGDRIEHECILFINLMLAYKNTSVMKFKDLALKVFDNIYGIYNSDKGIFIKESDKKEVDYSCEEIVLYILCNFIEVEEPEFRQNSSLLTNIYKHQFVNSGIVLSWPDTPNLDNPERYRDYSLKSEDLLEEQNFRMSAVATPEAVQIAPILTKSIKYNNKKGIFSQSKATFDSTKVMPSLFLTNFILNLPK